MKGRGSCCGLWRSNGRQQCTCYNAEIRKIKYNPAERFPFYIEREIVHNIFSLQSVIGIAEGAAQQNGKTQAQQVIPLLTQAEKKADKRKEAEYCRNGSYNTPVTLPQIKRGTTVMISADQDKLCLSCVACSVFRPVFQPEFSCKNARNEENI
jgi:hypothetical protein